MQHASQESAFMSIIKNYYKSYKIRQYFLQLSSLKKKTINFYIIKSKTNLQKEYKNIE